MPPRHVGNFLQACHSHQHTHISTHTEANTYAAHTHLHTHRHTHTGTHTSAHTPAHTHQQTHICAHTGTHTYQHTHRSMQYPYYTKQPSPLSLFCVFVKDTFTKLKMTGSMRNNMDTWDARTRKIGPQYWHECKGEWKRIKGKERGTDDKAEI